jgi:hypothetical protein
MHAPSPAAATSVPKPGPTTSSVSTVAMPKPVPSPAASTSVSKPVPATPSVSMVATLKPGSEVAAPEPALVPTEPDEQSVTMPAPVVPSPAAATSVPKPDPTTSSVSVLTAPKQVPEVAASEPAPVPTEPDEQGVTMLAPVVPTPAAATSVPKPGPVTSSVSELTAPKQVSLVTAPEPLPVATEPGEQGVAMHAPLVPSPAAASSVAKPGSVTSSVSVLTAPNPDVQASADAPLRIVGLLSSAMDSPLGAPANGEIINSLLKFLWWGDEFRRGTEDEDADQPDEDAFQKAGKRLARNLQWIQEIREDYAPSRVAKPVPRDFKFEPDEVVQMHNQYMHSLDWMPEAVREKYEQLQNQAQEDKDSRRKGKGKGGDPKGKDPKGKDSKGKSRGKDSKGKGNDQTSSGVEKPEGRQRTAAAEPHRFKKQTFNVCFFKSFGSKQLFWHLVKVGPDTQDLNDLLRFWKEVKSTPGYLALKAASQEKTREVAEKKRQVTQCKLQVLNAVWRRASKKEIDDAVAAHESAKLEWKALNRNMQKKGMH